MSKNIPLCSRRTSENLKWNSGISGRPIGSMNGPRPINCPRWSNSHCNSAADNRIHPCRKKLRESSPCLRLECRRVGRLPAPRLARIRAILMVAASTCLLSENEHRSPQIKFWHRTDRSDDCDFCSVRACGSIRVFDEGRNKTGDERKQPGGYGLDRALWCGIRPLGARAGTEMSVRLTEPKM